MNILEKLVKRRKELGLTQVDMAHRLGVTQASVSQFEAEGNDARLSTLQRYARAVGRSIITEAYEPTLDEVIAYVEENFTKTKWDQLHESVQVDYARDARDQIQRKAWQEGIR